MKKIILASASPRRRELFSALGVKFDIVKADLDERKFIEELLLLNGDMSPERQAAAIALEKARNALSQTNITDDCVVIGADTSVVADGVILGKPQDRQDALRMLGLLSGKTHKVISGIAAIDAYGAYYVDYAETLVHMREITNREAQSYVDGEYVLDKAGAYAIQGKASLFIEGIEGCYFNVVGLPIFKLAQMLKKFDIDLSCGGI